MKQLVFFLIFILIMVSSSQLIGRYFPLYYLLDEILVLLLFFIFLYLFSIKEISINKNYVVIISLIVVSIFVNFIYSYYSLTSFLFKLVFYVKSTLPYLFIPYLVRYAFNAKRYKVLINFLFLIALFGIYEFIAIQFIDTFYFGHNYPLKFRNHIFRASSLTSHPISMGMMAFITLIFAHSQKYHKIYLIVFFLVLLFTSSRIPLLLLVLYFIYYHWKSKLRITNAIAIDLRTFIFIISPIIIVLVLYLPTYFKEKRESTTIRSVAMTKGIKVYKNPVNIVIGNGIGTYGMHWSVENNSDIYKRINFPKEYLSILLKNKSSGMESFMVMILVEFGLIGTILFIMLITHLTKPKISTFKLYLIFVIIFSHFLYPLYTLPFIFLLNTFFPYSNLPKLDE